jgi:hypothetical protein
VLRYSIHLLVAFLIVTPAFAVEPFPPSFHTQEIKTNGTTLHVRIGGQGPAVVMLHGFGDTGDMWAPAAAALVKNHTVVVPDLRGMGLSMHPEQGYTKKNQAVDIAGVMDALTGPYRAGQAPQPYDFSPAPRRPAPTCLPCRQSRAA